MDATLEWKQIIVNHPYYISKTGLIWNGQKILKPWIHNGYYELTLQINKVKKHYPIHKLIADNFIPNPDSKKCVDHINGNRLDNSISNLRWATHCENMSNIKTTRSETGYKGASLTYCGKYKASICSNGKSYYLGIYKTPQEAHDAYCEAGRRLHGEFHNPGA
jgi:hypothetical protein